VPIQLRKAFFGGMQLQIKVKKRYCNPHVGTWTRSPDTALSESPSKSVPGGCEKCFLVLQAYNLMQKKGHGFGWFIHRLGAVIQPSLNHQVQGK
jgi:hypothetical protein